MGTRTGELREIPGPKTKEWLNTAKKHLFTTTVESDIVIARYDGPFVYDPDENEYLDFASGVGVSSFGGGDGLRHLWNAVEELKTNCGACGDIGSDWYNVPLIKAAEYIIPRIPLYGAENKIDFSTSGARANEAALELGWAYWNSREDFNRKAIICFEGAFHGRTGYVKKFLDHRKPVRFRGYPNSSFTVLRAPFPEESVWDAKGKLENFFMKLPKILRRQVSAVIMEVVQGEGGIRVPDGKALQWWVETWRNENAFVIVDDVQAGVARTGRLMSYEHYDFKPDIVTIEKHFASGVPAAAMLGPAWADWTEHGRHAESFSGTPLIAAAAHATLKHVLEYDVAKRNKKLGEFLRKELVLKLSSCSSVRRTRGIGLMHGVEFKSVEARDAAVKQAERMGLRTMGAGFAENPTIRIMPSFACNEEDIEQGVAILKNAIEATEI